MMIKLTGGILLVVCGTLCGLYAGDKLKARLCFFEDYLCFLVRVKSGIRYTASELDEILSLETKNQTLREMLRRARRGIEGGEVPEMAWRLAVDGASSNREDKSLLYAFGDDYGTLDADGELNRLTLHEELVRQHRGVLYEEWKTKRRLYRIVGMFAGILTAVILI